MKNKTDLIKLEQEKLAAIAARLREKTARSYVRDFVGGVDPTGGATFSYGVQDADATKREALKRRTTSAVGGVVGGATVIPAALGGVVGAVRGSRRGLRSAAAGFAKGTTEPFADLYHARRASSGLKGAASGKALSKKHIKSLDHLSGGKMGDVGKHLADRASGDAGKRVAAEAAEVVGDKYRDAMTGIGVSAGVGGVSAHLQYDKARQLGSHMTPEQRENFMKGKSKTAAAHKLEGRMKFQDLDISIEHDKGSKRHWKDPHSGESGSTTMLYPYGYIRGTRGTDGDHVDVYVGPHEDSDKAYVINQTKKPDFKTFDEQKVMLGFRSGADAKAAYLKHYNSPKFFGSMKEMDIADFKSKVLDKSNHGEKLSSAELEKLAVSAAWIRNKLYGDSSLRPVVKATAKRYDAAWRTAQQAVKKTGPSPKRMAQLDALQHGERLARRAESMKKVAVGRGVVAPFQRMLVRGMRTGKEDLNEKTLRWAKDRGHTVVDDPRILGAFNPSTKKIHVSGKDPNVLAHELGHAEIDRSRLGRMVQNKGTIIAGNLAPTAAGVGGVASGYQEAEDGRSRTGRDAALLGGAHLPQLGYEAGASVKGHKILKGLGASKGDLSGYRRSVGRAYGTYALNPVASAINYSLGRGIGRTLGKHSPTKAQGGREKVAVSPEWIRKMTSKAVAERVPGPKMQQALRSLIKEKADAYGAGKTFSGGRMVLSPEGAKGRQGIRDVITGLRKATKIPTELRDIPVNPENTIKAPRQVPSPLAKGRDWFKGKGPITKQDLVGNPLLGPGAAVAALPLAIYNTNQLRHEIKEVRKGKRERLSGTYAPLAGAVGGLQGGGLGYVLGSIAGMGKVRQGIDRGLSGRELVSMARKNRLAGAGAGALVGAGLYYQSAKREEQSKMPSTRKFQGSNKLSAAGMTPRAERIGEGVDTAALGALAAPYAAKGLAKMKGRPGLRGAIGRGAAAVEKKLHKHEVPLEVGALTALMPPVHKAIGRAADRALPGTKTANLLPVAKGFGPRVGSIFQRMPKKDIRPPAGVVSEASVLRRKKFRDMLASEAAARSKTASAEDLEKLASLVNLIGRGIGGVGRGIGRAAQGGRAVGRGIADTSRAALSDVRSLGQDAARGARSAVQGVGDRMAGASAARGAQFRAGLRGHKLTPDQAGMVRGAAIEERQALRAAVPTAPKPAPAGGPYRSPGPVLPQGPNARPVQAGSQAPDQASAKKGLGTGAKLTLGAGALGVGYLGKKTVDTAANLAGHHTEQPWGTPSPYGLQRVF